MSASYLRQSTASQSRAIGPFLDSTDFQTAKTGLTIANTDIKLVVNGGASANKNSGGGTHRVNGVYGITFDATDTATVGEIEVSVVVAGALPVFHKFWVLEEAAYDALFAASAPGYVANAPVNVAQFGGTNLTAASGIPEVKVASIANNAITAASINADAITDAKVASDVTIASVTGAVGSVTGNVGGNVTGSVGSVATGGITAGSIAADAIGASELAADAITEIQSGLATAANLATVAGYLDTEIAAILADTNELQTDLVDGGRLDLILDAINAKTTNLPSDPADASVIAGRFDTLDTNLGTVDTVVDAIKAKTDNLPSDPADASVIAGRFDTLDTNIADLPTNAELTTALGTADDAVLAQVALVKAKTDLIPASPAAVGSAMTLTTGERTAIANEVEAQIIDETDSEKVLTAITDKIAAANPSLEDLTLAAIASSVRTELTTELGRIDAAISSRASQASVDDVPTNSELATALAGADDAVLTAIGDLPTNAELATALGDIPTADENADALLKRDWTAVTGEASRSALNALRFIRNRFSLTTTPGSVDVFKEDDVTVAYSKTVTTDPDAATIVDG